MYGKKNILSCFVLLFFLCAASVAASENAREPEFDGYLFRLQEGSGILCDSEQDGVSLAVPGEGIYRAETLEDIAEFTDSDALVYVEPNYVVTLFEEEDVPWNAALVNAETAWEWGLSGKDVRVGIVDSGIYSGHEALQKAFIAPGKNYIKNRDETDVSDNIGHGTFVAGIIAASGAGGKTSGLAPETELVPLKCFDQRTSTIEDIARAIYGGVDEFQCDILNMSFGSTNRSETLEVAVTHAFNAGVILISAVGNDGGTTLNYPAAYDCVIGVSMVGQDYTASSKSQRNNSVFVTAPGELVPGLSNNVKAPYRSGSGTSFSCPHVTAVAALVKEARPDLDDGMFRELLRQTSVDLGEPGYDTTYGWGLVSVSGILSALPAVLTGQGEDSLLIEDVFPLDALLYAASYDASGQLISCQILSGGEAGTVQMLRHFLPLAQNARTVKVFALKTGLCIPVSPAAAWTRAGDETPQETARDR